MLNNLGLSSVKMCTVLPYFAGEQGCSQKHPRFRFDLGHRYFARCLAARWYGYKNKEFQKWWHRVGKELFGYDISCKEMADEVWQEWIDSGRPTVKGVRKNKRQKYK